ncbi:MAG: type II toxin-antitoxin system prevent-host-death family antitoxin [Methanosarcinaceae archaeon]
MAELKRGDHQVMIWQLQEAESKFSEVIEKALHNGPQEITKRGKTTVIILSKKEYLMLKRKQDSLVEFFKQSPLAGFSIDERSKDLPRRIDL